MIRAAAAILAVSCGALAADPPPGRTKARACVPCHGPLGLSVAPDAPNLAGQPRTYLEQQLKAFRGGQRKSEVMGVMAKPMTDEDIAQLAEWFASVKVEAREPR